MALSAEEQQRVDMVVDFAREHKWRLVSGAAAVVVALSAWLFFDSRRAGMEQESSVLRYQLETAVGDEDTGRVDELFDRLLAVGNPSYIELSGLSVANFRFWRGDKEGAEQAYRSVLAATDDPAMEAITSLRLAQVLIDLERPAEALEIVDGREPESETLQVLFEELAGDAHASMGEREKARERYLAVLESLLPVHGLAYEALIISKLGLVSQDGVDLGEVESPDV